MQKLNPSMDAETFAAIARKEREFIETKETRKIGLGRMTEARWKTLGEQLVEIGLTRKLPDASRLFLSF
jgi:NitT/TauT family transport system substrate-binding protein